MKQHGTPPRGETNVVRSALHEGRFGRMFRRLDPAPHCTEDQLVALADTMREDVSPAAWNAAAPMQDGDNDDVPAAYTYFGQFVDHDITFDPASSLQHQNDPDALTDFRSPRFDLDSLYGSGPADEPFQYERDADPTRLLLEANDRGEMDLPRTSQGIAIIGDPRNDENVIVSQLHLVFARAHNKLVDLMAADNPDMPLKQRFEEAQRLLRWHYQWIVAHDFVPLICGPEMAAKILVTGDDGLPEVKRRFYKPQNNPYMPVEFSVAAFRFGHSQVRPTYDLNGVVTSRPIFAPGDAVGELDDLRGFRQLPRAWTVDWSLFLPMEEGRPFQPSRLINSKLSQALFDLPGETDPQRQSLAFRNLVRGQRLDLPSGQDVARLVGAATVFAGEQLGAPDPTPLWFYILKEAELETDGLHLGTTGGRIVAEVLLGLIEVDKRSWLNVAPEWKPTLPQAGEKFTLSDLIRFAGI